MKSQNSKAFLPARQVKTQNNGFTLVELLISITIILLVIGVSMAGYSRFSQRQTLLNSGQTLKNTLRDVQSRAYNGEQSCASDTSFLGWYADFTDKKIYGQCSDDNTFGDTAFQISSDIAITPMLTPAGDKILFRSYPPGIGQSGTICLSDPKNPGTYYKVEVEYSGKITDQSNLVNSCP